MKKLILATAVVAASLLSISCKAADNVVLVTLDGLRWQEVFSGADKNLIDNTDFVANTDELKALFWRDDQACLLYTSPSPRDRQKSRMPSSA